MSVYKQKIFTVSSPVGGGKTYSAVDYSAVGASAGNKTVIVQPSTLLIDETTAQIKRRYRDVHVQSIYGSDANPHSVGLIEHHLQEESPRLNGEILLITHSAFDRIRYWHNRANWNVIHDEVPQIDWCKQFNLAEHVKYITDLFDIRPHGAKYLQCELSNRDPDFVRKMAANARCDDIWGMFAQLSNSLISDNWQTYVIAENYYAFKAGKQTSLTMFGLMNPHRFHGFASATIMAAALEQTAMYRHWTNLGVEFAVHKPITSKLRYHQHQNGDLVNIHYAYHDDWSKRQRQTACGNETLGEVAVRGAMNLFAAQPDNRSVYMCNLDFANTVSDVLKNMNVGSAEQLPNSPHGINCYQDRHNAAIFSALNPTPAHFEFLSEVAYINPQEYKTALYRQACYQAAGRTSIRDIGNTDPKHIVVMDKATADWLSALFPNSKVARLNLDNQEANQQNQSKKQVGRVRVHASDAVKVTAHRKSHIDELTRQLIEIKQNHVPKRNHLKEGKSFRNKESNYGQIFEDIYQSIPLFDVEQEVDFVWLLRDLSTRQIKSKHANQLLSPSTFDPDKSEETNRGIDNVISTNGIWLDNDADKQFGNGISPAEFAALFPQVKMYAFNSYSNNKDQQKYRIYIPTTQAMTPDAQKHIFSIIAQRLRKNRKTPYEGKKWFQNKKKLALEGKRQKPTLSSTKEEWAEYNEWFESQQLGKDWFLPVRREFHGFDTSKFNASALFYLPCQAAAGKDHSFFDCYNENMPDLDPMDWIKHTTIDVRLEPPPEPEPAPQAPPASPSGAISAGLAALAAKLQQTDQRAFKQARVDTAIEKWRMAAEGTGAFQFYHLKKNLEEAGLERYEILQILSEEAANARSEKSRSDRKAQIKTMLR